MELAGDHSFSRQRSSILTFSPKQGSKMASTDKYKLTYFNLTGLGETIRFLLAYGGIDFEDKRVEEDEWDSLKPKTPFGKIPVLEINGKEIHQSVAICRYLATKLNLRGKDEWESLQADIIVDTIGDLRSQIASYYYDPLEASKKSKQEPLIKETIPFYLGRLDNIVKENDGFGFVGKDITWADLYFASLIKYLTFISSINLLENYPNLKKVHDSVHSLPNIANWIARRPETHW